MTTKRLKYMDLFRAQSPFGISAIAASALAASMISAGGSTLGCSGAGAGEGIRSADIPANLTEEYALFSQRCSKCHSLARALASDDRSDAFWKRYVTRMRLQPSSGISPEEEVPILRFLHWYSQKNGGISQPSPSVTKEGGK